MAILLSSCLALSAQESAQTASIVLELTDQSGAVVPNANVMLLPLSCTLEKGPTTGKDGTLSLNVPPGNYDLRIQVPGFRLVEKHLEAQPASHQKLAILLKLDSCTECLDVRGVFPVSFPEGPQAVSRDGRYVVVSTGRPSASRHTLLLEDRVLKTRRKLLNYGKRVVVFWDQYEDLVAVTEYAGTESSRCTIFSVDQDVPPVEVLDLLRSELAESELKCLNSMLRNQHMFVQALGWDQGVFKVRVYEYGATGERGFQWEYAVGLPPRKP
jgi:hypothetical protein